MSNNGGIQKKVFSSLVWAFLERCGSQGVGLVINIVLARLLLPEDYGTLAIMVIFTNLANQFVQSGFNTSLIQNPDVTEEDYSSVLHVSLMISAALYVLLWFTAPAIAGFYASPGLVQPLRALSLVLFSNSLQGVQTAKLRREMDFKTIFTLTLSASLCGGAAGVILAALGAGVWALVAQQLVGSVSTCVVLYLRLRWRPRAVIDWARVRVLFSYGWKLLVSALLNTFYNDLTGLVIGKKYTSTMLAYYDKGQMLPNKLISSINDSVQSVMLPALAGEQSNRERCKQMMRRSVQVSCFVLFPMIAGLAAVAEPVVTILLTEKWLPCVPFLQLSCLIYLALPISVANLQAIKALGRSDVFLQLEVIKKIIGLAALMVTVFCFDSVLAILWGSAVTSLLSLFLNAFPNKKIVGYSFSEQMRDIFPALALASVMFLAVSALGSLSLGVWGRFVLQIAAGVVIYVGGAVLLRLESLQYTWNILRPYAARLFHR